MKNFRTELNVSPWPILSHEQSILTLGSCFAAHVGQRLLEFKWIGLNAPFGTLFHPLALEKLLRMAVNEEDLDEALFVDHDGAFFHHDLHSSFYATSRKTLQEMWQAKAKQLRECLAKKPLVLITFGTAFVHDLKDSGTTVANCHKQASSIFQKRLLGWGEIRNSLCHIRDLLPEGSCIITSLSPVRHTRDSLPLNSLSKSLLRVALQEWSDTNEDRVHYFPAYEIMIDDLRDYRFYERDGIHPSAEAIDYIWGKFCEVYLKPEALDFITAWQAVRSALLHRPQRMDAPSYQQFIRKILLDIESLRSIACEAEKIELKSRLL